MRFPVQIYSNRELEEQLTRIRDVLSDDKQDWELRVAAVRTPVGPLSRRRNAAHLFRSGSAAEEGPFSDAGRGHRVRGLPSAAPSSRSALEIVGERPAVAGGPGGVHHPGVRAADATSGGAR